MTKLGIDEPPRRRSDDNGFDAIAGAPWQVRAIVTIGVLGVLALGSFYFLAHEVRGYQQRTEPTINATARDTAAIAAAVSATEANHTKSTLEVIRILERIRREACQREARTIQEARRCEE